MYVYKLILKTFSKEYISLNYISYVDIIYKKPIVKTSWLVTESFQHKWLN